MQYLKQFMIISLIALAGEALSFLIPLPIPASIYGIIFLFCLLVSGLVTQHMIRKSPHNHEGGRQICMSLLPRPYSPA